MTTQVTNFEEAKKLFDSKVAIAAMNATLNKSVITVRAQASKQITSEYAVRAREVKGSMNLKRSNFSTLAAELNSSDVRLPLALFNPTQKKDGVSVKIKKKQPRQVLKRAFVATMKNGHKGVFTNWKRTRRNVKRLKRYPRRGPRPVHSELPIDQAFTIGVPQMWKLRQSERVARERIPVVFNQELNYRLSRKRGS